MVSGIPHKCVHLHQRPCSLAANGKGRLNGGLYVAVSLHGEVINMIRIDMERHTGYYVKRI